MQLSFYARGDVLVAVPGQARPYGTGTEMASGPPKRYVGREFVPPKNLRRTRQGLKVDAPAQYICSSEPFVCDSESDVGRQMVRHMTRKRCRRTGDYPLWPANKATADFLGIAFVQVEVIGGETVPIATASKAPRSAGKAED